MYGRGNYAAPVGQGPYASNPPFPQRPPPPPPPPFSQSSHLPLPTAIQLVQPPVPPQVGQLGRPVYQHAPPGPSQQGPLNPLLSSGINGQPFFTPALPPPQSQPLQVPGSSQMQQHLPWAHTAPFVLPTGPPSAPRVVPPPPSQGQTLLSSQVHQSPGNPPASSFYTSPPVGSFEHSMPPLSNTDPSGPPLPLPLLPPLPSSPPRSSPLPPSSPPPTSLSTLSKSRTSIPIPKASESAYHPEIGSGVNNSLALETSASGSLGGFSALYLVGDAVRDGELGSKTISAQGENLISDLSPPPLMPADDKTVHRIEVLCQFIARNGPEFEKMTCQKESGNPEFKFLFGGEPGSEAAAAHEYFLWTKRKYLLGSRSVEYQGSHDFSSGPSGGSSYQLNIMSNVGLPNSPGDSDMDMEDDITHPDEEPQSYFSNELSRETVSVSNRRDKEQELQPILSTAEHSLGKDAADENFMYSGLQGSGEQIEGTETSSIQNQSIIRIKVDGLDANSSGDVEGPLVTDVMKTSVPDEDLSQPNVSKNLAEIRSEKIPAQLVKQDASPFSLLQDYASGEGSDDEARLVAVVPTRVAPSVKVDTVPFDTDAVVDLGRDHGIKSVVESHMGLEQLPQSSCFKPEGVMVEDDMPSTAGKLGDLVDNICGHKEYLKDGRPQREPRQKDVSRDSVDANVKKNENSKSLSFTSKVDKFGRSVREGASDSESGGSPCYNRRHGKRGRSRSRSRSPHDTRRRRSPWRRKVTRRRSRSLSPKRRRSRSKSPSFRHGDEFVGDKMRRDKGHRSECFDFIRGKCYRGASCRYLHHDDKSDRSRSYRSKQQSQNLPYGSRSCDLRGETEMPYKKFSREHVEGRIQELKSVNEVPTTAEKKDMKEEMDEAATRFHDKSGPMEPLVHPIPEANMEKIPGDAAHGRPSPSESLNLYQSCGPKSSPMHAPAPIAVDKTHLNKEAADESCINSSSLNKTFPSEMVSSLPMEPTESITPDHPPRLLPSFASISQDTNSSFKQDIARDYNLNSPSAIIPSHSASAENRPPYEASLPYSHSQFPFPPNSSWSCLPPPPVQPHYPPPPPAFVNDRTLTPGPYSGPSVHIMQNMMPRRNDTSSQASARPFLTEFPTLSVCQKQAYPPRQEPNRSLDPLDDLHPSTFPMSQPMTWSHGGTGLAGEDRFAGHPGPGLHSSNSFGQNKMYSQTMPFSRESPSKRTQAFPGDNLPPADGVASLHHELGNLSSTLSNYTSDLLDRNQPSVFSDFGLSGIANHFNPYASTFDQPLSSKFTSNILRQQKDRPFSNQLGAAYSFSQVPVDGRDIASLGSRNLMSSQNSAHPVDGILPRPVDGQYDPLYDSIEPSLNSVRKSSYGQKLEITDESDVIVRFSGSSNKSLDEKNQKKQKGGESDESLENEAYGETGDGEGGAVENESLSNVNDAAETAAAEVEIDQVKARGKSKKSKDSRSMKLFKVTLADFVKEVLKPSWRQGNMSKEAFKTIVKKTVDRVSGAMKSHQIPKSQVKINHYIDSSQRKLTKLVMGYVDKYVKV